MIAPYKAGYPDAGYSKPITSPYIKHQHWDYTTMLYRGYHSKNPYETDYRPVQHNPLQDKNLHTVQTGPCGVSGYSKPFGA